MNEWEDKKREEHYINQFENVRNIFLEKYTKTESEIFLSFFSLYKFQQ